MIVTVSECLQKNGKEIKNFLMDQVCYGLKTRISQEPFPSFLSAKSL